MITKEMRNHWKEIEMKKYDDAFDKINSKVPCKGEVGIKEIFIVVFSLALIAFVAIFMP